jgi:hypothetical protein
MSADPDAGGGAGQRAATCPRQDQPPLPSFSLPTNAEWRFF